VEISTGSKTLPKVVVAIQARPATATASHDHAMALAPGRRPKKEKQAAALAAALKGGAQQPGDSGGPPAQRKATEFIASPAQVKAAAPGTRRGCWVVHGVVHGVVQGKCMCMPSA
jgi:hypothetical protein